MEIIKERPILFSAPMVNIIIQGRKTQTRRRIADFQQIEENDDKEHVKKYPNMRFMAGGQKDPRYGFLFFASTAEKIATEYLPSHCPYGKPGDRLWVRETHAYIWPSEQEPEDIKECRIEYRADTNGYCLPGQWPDDMRDDDDCPKWKPSIHMPRWASRINLEITNIRVERLQDISKEDAVSEGIQELPSRRGYYDPIAPSTISLGHYYTDPRCAFSVLWESINGDDSWTKNPWVWVIEFKRIK